MDTTIGKYVKNWNALDTVIYFIEVFAARITHRIHEETDEPDVEEIIQAETQHLQDEITYYKAHQRPAWIIERDGMYFCPECGKCLAKELVDTFKVKYCPECGKRLARQHPLIMEREDKADE
ncbi:MAG: hypothetical protein NC548_43525 [Lachnospiraceae bacterium]|nr:hypothetical protein [Lachnospiraceae bacterium]